MTSKPQLYALVGMRHRGTQTFVDGLPNREPLMLIREAGNRYDRNAVQVWARGRHAGYIKGTQAPSLAMAMDRAGDPRRPAKLHHSSADRWPMVEEDTPGQGELSHAS